MAKFTVHGGDFDIGHGWFIQNKVYGLHKNGKPVTWLQIDRTALAVRGTVEEFGGEKRFGGIGILDRVRKGCKDGEGAFIVRFDGDRVLLATADVAVCEAVARIAPPDIKK